MSGGAKKGGYTIVEIMLVIAVTGVLFLVAYATISGKQAQAQFTESVRDFQSNIIDLMNDVSTGYFPNTSAKCQLTGSKGSPVHFVNGPSSAGTNLECIFIGKVLQFNRTSGVYNIISVAGTRVSDRGQEVSSIAFAHPVAAVDDTLTPPVSLAETRQLNNGLRITSVLSTDTNAPNPGAIGFFTSFPQYNESAIAGVLNTDLLSLKNTTITDSLSLSPASGNAAVVQTNVLDAATFTINPTIVICLEQDGVGSNGRRAALIIGNHGRGATAELHIDDAVTAVDMIDSVSNGSPACTF